MELINHSTKPENLGKLYGALAKAQAEIEVAKKDKDNSFFKSKYADFAAVTQAVKPLHKYGLCYFQPVSSSFGVDGNFVIVETIIAHESGATISSSITVPLKQVDAQGVGSAITYGRRYGLMAMAGIAPDDDDDDDGNAAVGNKCNSSAPKQNNTTTLVKQSTTTSLPKQSNIVKPEKQPPEACDGCNKKGVPLKEGQSGKFLCVDCIALVIKKRREEIQVQEAKKKAELTPHDCFEQVGKTNMAGTLFEVSA